ncbi:LysM peptidoglycan-binding domain-containing protein [Marivirga sp.]|uniref:LysM peptidoglycan-binding domain-containing protein n=1 Tax=Marivirga sp. TaxID=2018662 RepID=UPI002D7E5323|nr:LysM peptidoglycan-binding domain-containing protein [Marivirga sp.]HET8860369.1 LysM peptidoglycan-binding domain-containing protein [Marivirga sp.]
MKIKILLASLFFIFIASLNLNASAVDSVGIKVIDGRKYIIHKLEPRETLYSLGKRYHVSVAEIEEVNPKEKDGYNIDQIGRELLIPYKEEEFASSAVVNSADSNLKKHTVKAGETIYSISKLYNVSQDDIMKWNDLQSSNLNIGQILWVSDPSKFPTNKKQNRELAKADNNEQIVHVVDLGETIYSISKQYEVTQSDIIELNGLKDNNIAVGQKLIIKSAQSDKKEEVKPEVTERYSSSVQTFHNAKRGETYEKVANLYNLEESDLKKWNKFKEPFIGGEVIKIVAPKVEEETAEEIEKEEVVEKVKLDSKTHTVQSGETLFSLAEKYNVEVEDLRKWNSLDNYKLSLGQRLYIKNPDALTVDIVMGEKVDKEEDVELSKEKSKLTENPQKQDTKAYFTVEEDDMPKINKIEETGIAEVIEGSEGTEKYLALHRTAKIGTIMQVRNDLNDQFVFVRVLGKLPNTGVDERVIIRISKSAFEKLGGVDYKFPVEISYLPLKD